MPSFNLDELPRFGEAALNVLFPSPQARDAFRYAAPLCAAPLLDPPAPFGFRGTLAWLNAALKGCGQATVAPEKQSARAGPHAAKWQALTQAAREYRVAVILRDDHFIRESDPHRRCGVPWLDCLDEMGFGLNLLVVKSGRKFPPDAGAAPGFDERMQTFENKSAHRIIPVDSEAGIPAALRDGNFHLVYTEQWRDDRVTAAGKTPFSILDFEMGFAGACRTLDRLLGYCRTPFYQRYRAHLKTPDSGDMTGIQGHDRNYVSQFRIVSPESADRVPGIPHGILPEVLP